MARLPTAQELGQRPVPSGQGGISRLQLSTPRLGAEAQAEIQFGKVVEGMGNTIMELAAKEKAKTDEIMFQEAYSKYQDSTLDLEYGKENGFINIQGGDAVKQPLVEDYRDKRKLIAGQIREGLPSDAQKIAFDKQASIVDRQFDARLYRHVSEQTKSYQASVSEGVMATERRAAALNWDQPGQIEMSLLRTDMEIERQARLNGVDSADVINNQKAIAGTMIHADVINQMLVGGKDSAAAAYYAQVKEQLTPEAIVILGNKVKSANIDGESVRAADVVWETLGPRSMDDPVRLDVMETWLRDKYKDNPAAMKAAVADVRSRAVAHKDGVTEMKASNEATVLQAYHDGADIKMLQSMTEYQALDGEAKVKLRQYINENGWTEQQRSRAQAQYREGEKAARGFSTYWELSNPQVLSTMSEKQILALEPVLGRTLTEDLMQGKRKLNSPENVKAATMDAEAFNVIAANAGLKPYDKSMGADQKEYLGRLRNEVEGAIDVEQRRTGKTLNREEKEKIMQSMVDKKVMVDEWGKDPSLPAPIIRPEQRNKVYVPMDQIDKSWLKGAINYMRSTGAVPMDMDDSTVSQRFKGRLERAYGVSITGGSSVEGKNALEGKEE